MLKCPRCHIQIAEENLSAHVFEFHPLYEVCVECRKVIRISKAKAHQQLHFEDATNKKKRRGARKGSQQSSSKQQRGRSRIFRNHPDYMPAKSSSKRKKKLRVVQGGLPSLGKIK